MKNWNYNELIETIKESYELGLEQGRSEAQAIGGVSEDFFFYPEEDNIVENLITLTQILKLSMEYLNYVTEGTIDIFRKQLALVTDDVLNRELMPEEVIALKTELYYLLRKIELVEIRKT